jgi:hypothetical protein
MNGYSEEQWLQASRFFIAVVETWFAFSMQVWLCELR